MCTDSVQSAEDLQSKQKPAAQQSVDFELDYESDSEADSESDSE